MEESLLPFTPSFDLRPWKLVEICVPVDRMGFGGLLWNAYGSSWKFCDARRVRWDCIRVYGSTWKLPLNLVVEAAIGRSMEASAYTVSENFHIASNIFHGSKCTSTNFRGSKSTSNLYSMDVGGNSVDVNRVEVGGPLRKSCRSSWKFVIIVEVGGSIFTKGHPSFHRIWSWSFNWWKQYKLPLVRSLKTWIYFHGEIPLTCMEVNLLLSVLMEVFMEAHLFQLASMEVCGSFHGHKCTSIYFHGTSTEAYRKSKIMWWAPLILRDLITTCRIK